MAEKILSDDIHTPTWQKLSIKCHPNQRRLFMAGKVAAAQSHYMGNWRAIFFGNSISSDKEKNLHIICKKQTKSTEIRKMAFATCDESFIKTSGSRNFYFKQWMIFVIVIWQQIIQQDKHYNLAIVVAASYKQRNVLGSKKHCQETIETGQDTCKPQLVVVLIPVMIHLLSSC